MWLVYEHEFEYSVPALLADFLSKIVDLLLRVTKKCQGDRYLKIRFH